nr:hypothetical protein [Deltaproteobacteria bacterium]
MALPFALTAALSGRSAAAQGTGEGELLVVLGAIRCELVSGAALQWSTRLELGARLAAGPPAAGRWFRVTVECAGADADIRVVDGSTGRSLHWHVDLGFEAPTEHTRTLALNIVEATHASRTELEALPIDRPTPASQPPVGPQRVGLVAAPRRPARSLVTRRWQSARTAGSSSRRHGLLSHAHFRRASTAAARPLPESPTALPPPVGSPVQQPADDGSVHPRASAVEADAVFGVRTFTMSIGTL